MLRLAFDLHFLECLSGLAHDGIQVVRLVAVTAQVNANVNF